MDYVGYILDEYFDFCVRILYRIKIMLGVVIIKWRFINFILVYFNVIFNEIFYIKNIG